MPKPSTTALPTNGALITLAVILAVAVYLRALSFDFVYDDIPQIVQNAMVLTPRSWTQYFTINVWSQLGDTLVGAYYRPLFLLWLAANHALFGLNPLPWHLTSILLHASVTYLLFVFARRVGFEPVTAGIAALIFAVHPIHIESVAWISGVTDPLCAFFLLVAALCHLRGRAADRSWGRIVWPLCAMAALGLALASKEIAVTFPGFIVALEWLLPDSREIARSATRRAARAVARCLPYALVVAAYLGIRVAVLGSWANDATGISPTTTLLTLPMVLVHYLRLFLLPVGLSVTYDLSYITRPEFARFVVPLLLLLAVAIILIGYCRRRPLAATALMWAVITLSPALLLWKLPPDDFVHDRYLYIPSLGMSMLIATAGVRIPSGRLKAFGHPAAPILLGCLMLLLLAYGTVIQSIHWRNGLALFANAVIRAPSKLDTRTNYAIQLMSHQHYDQAQAQFERVLARAPDNWSATYGIGQIRFLRGQWRDAIDSLEHAIALRPYRPEQYIHLGYARLRDGDLNGGEAAFREAIARQPLGLGHHYALGVALAKQGRWSEALAAFERELAIDPGQRDTLRQVVRLKTKLAPAAERESIR